MRKSFDRRVVPEFGLAFVRACQTRVSCHLGGGAALAGAYLGHRTTGDLDLFVHDSEQMRSLVGLLPAVAAEAGIDVALLRDAGHLVRAQLADRAGNRLEVDVVHEPVADIATPPTHPLPAMLVPLSEEQLEKFRDSLAEKLRSSAIR